MPRSRAQYNRLMPYLGPEDDNQIPPRRSRELAWDHLGAILLLSLLLLLSVAFVIMWVSDLAHRVVWDDIKNIGTMNSYLAAILQIFFTATTAGLLILMQRVLVDKIIKKSQNLGLLHHQVAAWGGLGDALFAAKDTTMILGTRAKIFIIVAYLGANAIIGITSSNVLGINTFNVTVGVAMMISHNTLNLTTAISFANANVASLVYSQMNGLFYPGLQDRIVYDTLVSPEVGAVIEAEVNSTWFQAKTLGSAADTITANFTRDPESESPSSSPRYNLLVNLTTEGRQYAMRFGDIPNLGKADRPRDGYYQISNLEVIPDPSSVPLFIDPISIRAWVTLNETLLIKSPTGGPILYTNVTIPQDVQHSTLNYFVQILPFIVLHDTALVKVNSGNQLLQPAMRNLTGPNYTLADGLQAMFADRDFDSEAVPVGVSFTPYQSVIRAVMNEDGVHSELAGQVENYVRNTSAFEELHARVAASFFFAVRQRCNDRNADPYFLEDTCPRIGPLNSTQVLERRILRARLEVNEWRAVLGLVASMVMFATGFYMLGTDMSKPEDGRRETGIVAVAQLMDDSKIPKAVSGLKTDKAIKAASHFPVQYVRLDGGRARLDVRVGDTAVQGYPPTPLPPI